MMWPERKEGCAGRWEEEFRATMGGEVVVVGLVLVGQVVGWGVGRWFQAKKGKGKGREVRRAGERRGGSGRERGNGMVNGEGGGSGRANGQGGNANGNSWWNKLLQSFGVPHGDEDNTYRGLEDGRADRMPLLGEGGHVGIEEVDDDEEEEDDEERDVERGGDSDGDDGIRSDVGVVGRGGGRGYGSSSRVQPSGIRVDDPWRDGN